MVPKLLGLIRGGQMCKQVGLGAKDPTRCLEPRASADESVGSVHLAGLKQAVSPLCLWRLFIGCFCGFWSFLRCHIFLHRQTWANGTQDLGWVLRLPSFYSSFPVGCSLGQQGQRRGSPAVCRPPGLCPPEARPASCALSVQDAHMAHSH